jgi:hypothetical protein
MIIIHDVAACLFSVFDTLTCASAAENTPFEVVNDFFEKIEIRYTSSYGKNVGQYYQVV